MRGFQRQVNFHPPHHQGCERVLRHGRDPYVRQRAEEIIAGQRIEIEAIRTRLALLAKGGRAEEAFPALGGVRG